MQWGEKLIISCKDFVNKINEDENHKAGNAAVSLQTCAKGMMTDVRLRIAARIGHLYVRKEKTGKNGT